MVNAKVLFCARCDQTSNCFDKSDEENCKLLSMEVAFVFFTFNFEFCLKVNYNKKIAPFSFDRVKNANIPVTINVSMSVIDILKIEEVDHVYTLKFGLVLEW